MSPETPIGNIEIQIGEGKGVKGSSATVIPATMTLENGERRDVVVKKYESSRNASKEERILERLGGRYVPGPARVITKFHGDITGGNAKVTLIESRVWGEPVGLYKDSVDLKDVRRNSEILFNQLAAVAEDKILINEGIAYCGDISPSNVVKTDGGYVIVDWGGEFGLYGGRELTRGYIAPEVLDQSKPISFVEADTYSLGSLFVRLLLGKSEFDRVIEPCEAGGCVTFEKIKDLVNPQTQDFFKVVLSGDPSGRVLPGVREPGEHYRELAKLFLMENS